MTKSNKTSLFSSIALGVLFAIGLNVRGLIGLGQLGSPAGEFMSFMLAGGLVSFAAMHVIQSASLAVSEERLAMAGWKCLAATMAPYFVVIGLYSARGRLGDLVWWSIIGLVPLVALACGYAAGQGIAAIHSDSWVVRGVATAGLVLSVPALFASLALLSYFLGGPLSHFFDFM